MDTHMEHASEPTEPISPVPAKSRSRFIIFSLCGIFLLLIGLFGGYMFGKQQSKDSSSSNPVKPTPTHTMQKPTTPDMNTSPTPTQIKKINIPSDWKSYTATDPDFGVTATMSLPPGYSFAFTGSEFTIQNNDATELWDYSTSVFNGKDGLKNYYDGTSRRAWYQRYIDGDFGNTTSSGGKITSVDDTKPSYLAIIVSYTTPRQASEMNYVFVKNGIVNVLRLVSMNTPALTPFIPQIVDSITVTKTK